MKKTPIKFPILPLLATLCVLGGCGGSEVGSTVAPPPLDSAASPCNPAPEGEQPALGAAVVGGTIAGRTDPSFVLLVVPIFDQEAHIMVYGPDLATSASISGFVRAGPGYGCSSNNRTSYNGNDHGLRATNAVYLRTTVDAARQALSGSIRYASATYRISGGPLPGARPSYAASQPANFGDIEGTWNLLDPQGDAIGLRVDRSGRLAGSYRGCAFEGSAQPDAGGINRFDLALVPNDRTCAWDVQGLAFDGVLLAYPLANGGQQAVLWAETYDGWDYSIVVGMGRR